MDFDKTIDFTEDNLSTKEILKNVYESLEEKGYNPKNQIIGYLLSGDPAFIPRYKNSRNLIKIKDRDKILEDLLVSFLEEKIE